MGTIDKEKEFVKINVKLGEDIYFVLVDKDDFHLIDGKKLVVLKQRGYATISVYLGDSSRKRSLGKLILGTERNVYLKNRLIQRNNKVLDYRKCNLSTNIKDMVGYSDIARDNFYKNKEKIMCKRHEPGVYNVSVADKLIKKSSGEQSNRTKLTYKDALTIRERYISGFVTQNQLAREYKVSRSTISSIITYKRWRNFHLRDTTVLKKANAVTLYKKKYSKKHLSFEDFKESSLVYLKDDKLIYYLEKINDDGLVYFEIRNNNDDVLVRSDLLFSDELNNQTNREYSIAYKYPVKTPISDLVFYVDKLKEYI